MHTSRNALTLGALALVAASCTPAPATCDGASIRQQIAALLPGESLVLEASCVVEGSLTVPAGATVRGGMFALDAEDAITLTPSPEAAPVTTLEGTRVTGGGRAAVVVRGAGHARIAATSFEIVRGIAIGVAESSVTIEDVDVTGNVDPARVLDVPSDATGFARYGVVAIEGARVEIVSSELARLATAGVACEHASLTMTDVTLEENRGIGLLAFGCMVDASNVEVARTLAAPGLVGMGFALVDSSVLAIGDSLRFHDAPGFGVYASASEVTLTGPTVERMEQAGVWAENGSTLHVAAGAFTDNEGIAIGAVGAIAIDVRGTTVTGTRDALLPSTGGGGADLVADAIHVAQTSARATTVSITDTTLVDNGRVGLVLDGGGGPLALTLTGTRVEGTGDELGAVAQNVAALPVGWDSGVTRVGSAASLDAVAGALVVSDGTNVGVLMPPTISF